MSGNDQYNPQIWRDFGDKVGWRKNKSWLSYKHLTFEVWAPQGHLPMLGMQFWGFTGWLTAILNRLQECQLPKKR